MSSDHCGFSSKAPYRCTAGCQARNLPGPFWMLYKLDIRDASVLQISLVITVALLS